ncbi:MAG: nucleotidyl transferase AbiEii/AbiGii toxin family protein [Prevotellaceae bacterium]|jgi:hypothetical protein|nr:nucleotidyl transferase AbiEii/AbiGii toxin family protein [Prevotellaceae bacterium]
MQTEIFSEQQKELLPCIARFRRSFYLVGGTAIALHLGHRRSIDFDLFTPVSLRKSEIKKKLWQLPYKQELIFEDTDQLHLYVNAVKVTFFSYPYPVEHPVKLDKVISMPTLLSLAAMKAFALGRRAKWKDYVDLYFLLKNHFSIGEIAMEAEKLFQTQFSEKLFREQLAFHKDINYTEEVAFMEGYQVNKEDIKAFLIEKSLDWYL